MIERRKTRQIFVGKVPIGGDAPISIQSMTNTATQDVAATVAQIGELAAAGCQIARVAVPDTRAAQALGQIVAQSVLPVVADIHFDYRLALTAIEQNVAALRLNPGNIGGAEKVLAVAEAAGKKQIPIRVGVNGGSLSAELRAKYGGLCVDALVEGALEQIKLLEQTGFELIKISLKCSDVPLMLGAYQKLANYTDYPFHIGVTEAGTPRRGSIKSAAGIGALLGQGLGDTLRVSLAGDPVEEIFVAKEILRSLGLYAGGVSYIVCPTCGRTKYDLPAIADEVERRVDALEIRQPLKVAVMGCVVNGPGEARDADVGIAGGIGSGMIFAHGCEVGRYPVEQLVDQLLGQIEKIIK